MKQTLLTILTDPQARQEAAVQENLKQEFSAGAPWFNAAEQ